MKIGTLTIDMVASVARLEQDMKAARRSVDGAMKSIQNAANLAMKSLAALGVGFGTMQLTTFIRSAINAGDEMSKMSQKTGVAVEKLAGIQLAFRQGGSNATEMQAAIAKLVVAMKTQNAAFLSLNITSTDTFGALSQVSDRFQSMPDGARKSALAYELFGRSGLQLIPILNAGSEGLQGYIDLSEKLGLVVGSNTAKQFEIFNDTLDTVGAAMDGIANQAAIALIPTLQSLADLLLTAFTNGSVQTGVSFLIDSIKVLSVVIAGRLIASLYAMGAALTATAAGVTTFTGVTARLGATIAFLGGPVGAIAAAAMALIYFSKDLFTTSSSASSLSDQLNITNAHLDLMSKTDAGNKLLEVNGVIEKQTAELAKLNAEFDVLNENYLTISDPEALLIGGAEFEKQAKKISQLNQEIVVLGQVQGKLGTVVDGTTKKTATQNFILEESGKKTKSAQEKIRDLITAYQFETDTLLMTNDEKERAIYLQTLENEGIKQGTALWYDLVTARSQAEKERANATAIKESQDARVQAEKETIEAQLKVQEDHADRMREINFQIGQSLTDALMQGGLDAKNYIENMFKTLILRPLLQPLISGTLGALGVGASGAALAGVPGAVSGGGGTDFLGLASTLKDGYTMLSSGFAAVGTAASQITASVLGHTAAVDALISSQAALAGATTEAALAAEAAAVANLNSIGATAASVGAAATVLAGVAAGIGAGTFISGQYALGGDQIISTGIGTAIGTGIGFAIGGPIGAAIGALVGGAGGGLINRAFGQGPKQTQNAGITGSIGAGSTSLSQFTDWKRSGGWFSSGSRGRNYSPANQDIVDYFNETLTIVSASVGIMALSIGQSADRIAGYSERIEISLLGLTDVQAQERLQGAITNFTNNLVTHALPAIRRYQRDTESASQTLTRLSQSLATANQIFGAMDLTTSALTIEAADSASTLIDLTGGMEAFVNKMDFVYQNFYTTQDRIAKATSNLTSTFETMGLVLPQSREGFKQLIEIVQKAGSATLLAALLEIAPAFDTFIEALDQSTAISAQKSQQILTERVQFENKISQALGDVARLRQRELEDIDESNRALAIQLYALADAQDMLIQSTNATDQAFADLEKSLSTRLNEALSNLQTEFDALTDSIDAQIVAATEAQSAAQKNIDSLKGIFTYLQEQINDINGLGRTSYSYAQAMAFLAQAESNITTGNGFPEQAQLASAVSAARTGLQDTSQFATSVDQQRATAVLLAQLIRLKDATGNQISIEEQQLMVAQQQLASLYAQYDQLTLQYAADQEAARSQYESDLNAAKTQIEALRNIDNSVYSVQEAIDRLNESTIAERSRIVSLQQIMVSLQQDANVRAQAEADRIEADRQAAINAEKARVEALRQAQIRAEQQAAAERAAEAERIAAQQRAEAAAAAARAAAAAAEAERLRREAEARAAWFNGMFWGDWGNGSSTSQQSYGSLPGNADGGMFQGGLSIVGEEGPELVNFARPSMIYTAEETQNILNGGSSDDSASEIRQLRAENQAQSRAMVSLQNRMTRLLERWDGDGMPEERALA